MNSTINLSELFLGTCLHFFVNNFFDEQNENELLSDNEILQKIIDWNKNIFSLLLDRYSDKIYRYIFYHFNFDKKISQDLTQEVFLHVWNKLNKFDNEQKFEPWLYRLAHNCCIDWIRKNKNNLSESSLDNISYDIWEAFDENDLENNYKQKLIYQILEKLDHKSKHIIILSYFEQKSYDEIAYIIWISKWAVWTSLTRARNKLKDIINSDDVLKDALNFDL